MKTNRSLSKTITQLFVLLIFSMLLSTTTLATDTIDNAPEEKERALADIAQVIEDIKILLDRCESDVCQQVRENADKRHELVMQAQRDMDDAARYLTQIERIVREDIAALERCESDVCRTVLDEERNIIILINSNIDLFVTGEDLDSDGDGIPDVVERGEQIEIDGFESFSVYKQRTDRLVEYTVVASRGSGAGRASLQSFTRAACPEERCEKTITIEIENSPPVAATIPPDILAIDDAHLAIDDSGNIVFGSSSVCSEREQDIHCLDSEGSIVFSFVQEASVSCTTRDDELWCWGSNERGAETQVVFTPINSEETRAGTMPNMNATECRDPPCPGYPYGADDTNTTAQKRSGPPDSITHQGRILDNKTPSEAANDEEDRARIREHLRNQTTITGSDFGLAIAYAMSGNERVREVRYDNNTGRVHVEEEREVRLLGFIPVRARVNTVLSEEGLVSVERPWWSILGRDTHPTTWMQPESIQAIISGAFEYCPDGTMVQTLADCPDHVDTTTQTSNGEEVDILGMGEEKLVAGRNPQTGKEIQLAAKTVDKATPALAQASAHVREGDNLIPLGLSVQKHSVSLSDDDVFVCGRLADGTPVCSVKTSDGEDIFCWGLNADSCPSKTRGEDLELAVEKIERAHPRPSNSPFEVLDTIPIDDMSVLLVVHTGDVPDEDEVAMNKAELVEAIASSAGISKSDSRSAMTSGFIKIEGVEGESRTGIPPPIIGIAVSKEDLIDSPIMLQEDGVYLNMQDWDLPNNSLTFVELVVSDTSNGDTVMRILKKKLPE